EARERYFMGQTLPVELCQPVAQARADLIATVGHEEEQGVRSTAPCQVVEELEAGVVAPMHILHAQQHGRARCLARDELGEGGEEAALLLFGIERRQRRHIRWQGYHIGQQREQRRSQRVYLRTRWLPSTAGEVGSQQVEERRVGTGQIRLEA